MGSEGLNNYLIVKYDCFMARCTIRDMDHDHDTKQEEHDLIHQLHNRNKNSGMNFEISCESGEFAYM